MATAFDMIIKYTPLYKEARWCVCGDFYIGYWCNKYSDGSSVREGDTITEKAAKRLLQNELEKIIIPDGNWNDNQKEALKSLIYYLQHAWDESKIKKAIEDGNLKDAKKLWFEIKDSAQENLKPWKQEEIDLFFGED